MEIILKRDPILTKGYTLGQMRVNDRIIFHTCEDEVREIAGKPALEWKIHGQTAIPRGKYPVRLSFSNRFQKVLPEVLNVEGFKGIRIHAGNTPKDTEGCILIGLDRGHQSVVNSRPAMTMLMDILAAHSEKVWLIVS